MQKNWRMLKVKWNYELIRYCSFLLTRFRASCMFMQRAFRGHKGRDLFFKRMKMTNEEKQMHFFNEQAKIIQK